MSKTVKKVSKGFSTLFDNFRAGHKRNSKSVKKFFDTIRQLSRGTIFPAPFGGSDFPPRKKAEKNPPQSPLQNSPKIFSEKFPSDFYRSLLLPSPENFTRNDLKTYQRAPNDPPNDKRTQGESLQFFFPSPHGATLSR